MSFQHRVASSQPMGGDIAMAYSRIGNAQSIIVSIIIDSFQSGPPHGGGRSVVGCLADRSSEWHSLGCHPLDSLCHPVFVTSENHPSVAIVFAEQKRWSNHPIVGNATFANRNGVVDAITGGDEVATHVIGCDTVSVDF